MTRVSIAVVVALLWPTLAHAQGEKEEEEPQASSASDEEEPPGGAKKKKASPKSGSKSAGDKPESMVSDKEDQPELPRPGPGVRPAPGKAAASRTNPAHDTSTALEVKRPGPSRSRDPITGVGRIGSDFVYDCHETWLHAGSRVSPRQEPNLFAMNTKVLTAGNALMKLLRDSRSYLFALQPARVGGPVQLQSLCY